MAPGPGTPEQTLSTHELIGALARASLAVQQTFERAAATHGIPPTQARLLGTLSDRAPTINELAELLGLDKSSTSGLVDRAQGRGLVRRVPSQLDRRSVRVRVTDQGRALADEVDSHFQNALASMLDAVPAQDHAVLAAHLNALHGN